MSSTVPREWASLKYLNPTKLLLGFRDIAIQNPLHELPYEIASLRTHALRKYGEGRQAALFCYGMSQATGIETSFALSESRDHDIVVRFYANNKFNFVPVQLKEFVPNFLNGKVTLQKELDKLSKYADSSDLVVAFYLNRVSTINLSELIFPKEKISELWFFGATDPLQNEWTLIGNLLKDNALSYNFKYPFN